MPAYEYQRELKAFVKECRCGKRVVGHHEEEKSHAWFLIEFELDRQTADGFRSLCRDCTSNVRTKSRGVKPHDRQAILKKQNGCCAICQREIAFNKLDKPKANVDHNSITGNVRGVLCTKCNQALGLFQHDIAIMEKAIFYLRSHSCE